MELVFVLVSTGRGVNIGAAARALHTMGFEQLRLVRPAPGQDEAAYHVAHGSTHVLDQAGHFDSLADAVADCDLVVGSTARRRGARHDYLTPEQLLAYLDDHRATTTRCAVVFGSEESGLTNVDAAACHVLSTIPMQQEYPSLNLGQAVMVYAYQLRTLGAMGRQAHTAALGQGAAPGYDAPGQGAAPAAILSALAEVAPAAISSAAVPPDASVRVLQERLERLLTQLEFDPDRALSRRIMERAALLRGSDFKLAHSLLQAVLQHLQR